MFRSQESFLRCQCTWQDIKQYNNLTKTTTIHLVFSKVKVVQFTNFVFKDFDQCKIMQHWFDYLVIVQFLGGPNAKQRQFRVEQVMLHTETSDGRQDTF